MKNTHVVEGEVVRVTVPHNDGSSFIFTVDVADLPLINSKASWGMDKNKTSAVANFREAGRMVKVTMHRLLTGWKHVNFADGDRFNLRRTNLVEAEQRKRRRKSGQSLKGNTYRAQQDHIEMVLEGKNPGIVLIDKEDLPIVAEYTWNINPATGYVQTKTREGRGKSRGLYLHRLIMGAGLGDNQLDHIDRNRLNNKKENLRFVTWSENQLNKNLPRNSTTGFRGVYITKNFTFCAHLRVPGNYLKKTFPTFEQAKAQRLAWEKEYGVLPQTP